MLLPARALMAAGSTLFGNKRLVSVGGAVLIVDNPKEVHVFTRGVPHCRQMREPEMIYQYSGNG